MKDEHEKEGAQYAIWFSQAVLDEAIIWLVAHVDQNQRESKQKGGYLKAM